MSEQTRQLIEGPREIGPGGEVINLRDRSPIIRPYLVPAGTTFFVKGDGTYIVVSGVSGTTMFVLPPPGQNCSDVYIRNGVGGTVTVEPNGATLAGVRTPYTMVNKDLWLSAFRKNEWYVKLDDGGSFTHTILDGSIHSDSVVQGATKGSLIVANSTPKWDELVVGTDGQVLTADSAQSKGVKWATPSTTTLPAATPHSLSFDAKNWAVPAAKTELQGSIGFRSKVDLTGYTQARIVVATGAAPVDAADLRVEYSTDQSTWNYMDHSSGPTVTVNGSGCLTGSWVTMNSAARADVFVRFVGINGTPTTVQLCSLALQVKP